MIDISRSMGNLANKAEKSSRSLASFSFSSSALLRPWGAYVVV